MTNCRTVTTAMEVGGEDQLAGGGSRPGTGARGGPTAARGAPPPSSPAPVVRAQRSLLVRPVGFAPRPLRPMRDSRDVEIRWRLRAALNAMGESDYISAHNGAVTVHAALSVERTWAPLVIDQDGIGALTSLLMCGTDAELLCVCLLYTSPSPRD